MVNLAKNRLNYCTTISHLDEGLASRIQICCIRCQNHQLNNIRTQMLKLHLYAEHIRLNKTDIQAGFFIRLLRANVCPVAMVLR